MAENNLPPSLKDLTEGLKGDNKSAEDLEKEKTEQADKEKKEQEEKLAQEEEQKKKEEEERRRQEEEKNKNNPPIDGKTKNLKDSGNGEEDNNEDESYWTDVEKITGEKVEVDFGDVDPLSPEGAAKYAQVFREKGIESFEDQLEKTYPREYKALMLAVEGIDPSFLYKDSESISYKDLKIDEKNTIEQENIYETLLKTKGIPEEDIKDLVKAAKETGKLFDKSKVALTELQKIEQNKEEDINKEAERKLQIKKQLASSMVKDIDEVVGKGEIGNLLIPEADKKAFTQLLRNTIQVSDDGKYYIHREISKDNLIAEMQAEYFKMKKGDISKLVERAAKTENAKRLKKSVENDKKKMGNQSDGTNRKNLSLKDL